jgi:polar amino acid transport system substrate-binding protein
MQNDPSLIASFAPTGKLRAVINLGNPVLAHAGSGGVPTGTSVDLARALAAQLGVECELIAVQTAGKSVDLVSEEQADIGFFAIDPIRGAKISFTAPYVLIEGTYLVRDADTIQSVDEVDQSGNHVIVGQGSAYDLYLTRTLKHATISRVAKSEEVVDEFMKQGTRVAAGVRQQLEADATRVPNLRVLGGRFMTIRQAVGVPKSRGAAAAEYLARFVEERKVDGFVARALAHHNIMGAAVAPAGAPD